MAASASPYFDPNAHYTAGPDYSNSTKALVTPPGTGNRQYQQVPATVTNQFPTWGVGAQAGPAAPTVTAPVVNPYQTQINQLQAQLGQLDTTQNVGLGNIANSYNSSLNKLTDQYGRAQRDYTTGVQDTQQGYQSARDAAATQARNNLGALQRLLGIGGSGNSSAAQDAVPLAVGQEASAQIAPVQTAYAQNRRNQDTNFGDTTANFNSSKGDLSQQKFAQEQGLKASIAQAHADLLSKIQNAGGPDYSGQVSNLLAQVAQLGNQYQNPIALNTQANYTAPTLAQYLLGQSTAPTAASGQPGADSVNPLFLSLLNKDQQNPLAVA